MSAPPSIANHTLLSPVGHGAYGEVWLARDALGLLRAVKIVYRRSFPDARPYDREFEGIRRFTPLSLQHPGLVRILTVGRDDAQGWFYSVMEAADDQQSGADIDPAHYRPRTLESDLRPARALPIATAVPVAIAVGEALAFLHLHRLVHRDVKPANILFIGGRPRLADAGLVTDFAEFDGDVSHVGTRGYLPLEGPGKVAADIYALGKLLYVAISGRGPGDFPELPDGFENRPDAAALLRLNPILLRACDPEPEKRFASMDALVSALKPILPPGQPPPPPAP